MSIYRIQLKANKGGTISDQELLEFCKKEKIIGAGWAKVDCKTNDFGIIKSQCSHFYPGDKGAPKAIHTLSLMKPGDFVWTRSGGRGSDYYLCRVDKRVWINRNPKPEYYDYDVPNYVGCTWYYVGNVDDVPGRVVNSFRASATVQSVNGVEAITHIIWNSLCKPEEKVKSVQTNKNDFWNMINPEELECLVFLYLQTKGYYVYSTYFKNDTKTVEGVLVAKDGSHKCYPQVKQNSKLDPEDYAQIVEETNNKVVLFSTSENYGNTYPNVICLKKSDLWKFIEHNKTIIPSHIQRWLNYVC